MRFCTTCGRKYGQGVMECPHDGTPLFDMGASDDDGEVGLEVASGDAGVEAAEPVAAARPVAEERVVEEPVVDEPVVEEPVFEEPGADDDLFLGADDEEDSEELMASEPELHEERLIPEASYEDSDASYAPDEAPVAEEAIEDDLLAEEPEVDEAPSIQIAAGIEDELDDLDTDTANRPALSASFAEEEDDDLLEPGLAPIRREKKKGGAGLFVGLLILLAVGLVAAWLTGALDGVLGTTTPAVTADVVDEPAVAAEETPEQPAEQGEALAQEEVPMEEGQPAAAVEAEEAGEAAPVAAEAEGAPTTAEAAPEAEPEPDAAEAERERERERERSEKRRERRERRKEAAEEVDPEELLQQELQQQLEAVPMDEEEM